MERNLFKYIWSHTRREQIWIVFVTILAMVPYYLSFDLPKQIINGPISGIGFEGEGATLPFLRMVYDLPFIGELSVFSGVSLERLPLLFALSLTFLALVIVNGLVKIYINTFKGQLGERLLRRIRYDLVDRILRFPPSRFKNLKSGEVASMVKDEVEPFGGFSGEAFASPVMLAGQTFTAMLFIFVQHVGLGLVALAMALIQVLIIPKLRARLIVLGRERQLNARQFAGRVAEIVDGIETIRGSDATNYVRADIVDRLWRIFRIRFDIYQWKFFVKFLNNFIAQLTPFIFYLFGGYLAIIGKLDVGQLIAVINAYKELPGPMKGLIDYDMARQDIQVKYETIVSQFDLEPLIEPELLAVDPEARSLAGKDLRVQSLSVADDSGAAILERATTLISPGETVALVGNVGGGADALAEVIGGVVWPTAGAVFAGESNLLQLPRSVASRQITYASASAHLFSGTLNDSLLLGLRNAPRGSSEDAEDRQRWLQEAELTGNPSLNVRDNWLDEAAILKHTGASSLPDALRKVLDIVELREDLTQIAIRCPLDPVRDADLAETILELRKLSAKDMAEAGLEGLVLPFDRDLYNDAATIGENLYFGHFTSDKAVMTLGTHDFMAKIARETGLAKALFASGKKIAEAAVSLLGDLSQDHPIYERMKLMNPEGLREFRQILARTEGKGIEEVAAEDRFKLLWLNARYSEPEYRFGILTDDYKDLIVTARKRIRREIPEALSHLIEFYDFDRYLFHADIRENIIFGKPNPLVLDVEARLQAFGAQMRTERSHVVDRAIELALTYDVGPGGARLSATQRGKINLARGLLRASDIYVFNRPLVGLDQVQQRRIKSTVLSYLKARPEPPMVLWVQSDAEPLEGFSRVLRFEDGALRSEGQTEPEVVGTPRGEGA